MPRVAANSGIACQAFSGSASAQFWGTYQGYRHSGMLTPDLRQTFYYHVGWEKTAPAKRDVEPIRYNE